MFQNLCDAHFDDVLAGCVAVIAADVWTGEAVILLSMVLRVFEVMVTVLMFALFDFRLVLKY